MIMKQIYVGSTQRSQLYNLIKKTVIAPHLLMLVIFVLLILIPISFSSKIFHLADGNLSPVVYVETAIGTGSAVYIGNGHLLTAAHVVSGMMINDMCDIEFQNPNDENVTPILAKAVLVATGNYLPSQDPTEDFALLNIMYVDADKIAQKSSLANESNVKVQDKVSVIGFPSGTYSVTQGIISNTQGGMLGKLGFKDLYVVDAKAWLGNSGGALFNENNQLLGIVISIGVVDGYNDDQTCAVKISKIRKALSDKNIQL